MWRDRVANAYCHLDLSCLKSFNPNMKMEQLYMDDETFLQCTEEHFKYLSEAGVLSVNMYVPFTKNKLGFKC